jgi:hypothetical protein
MFLLHHSCIYDYNIVGHHPTSCTYEDVMLQQHIEIFTTYYTPYYNTTCHQHFNVNCTLVTSSIYSHWYIIHRCLQHQRSQCNILFHDHSCSQMLIQYGPMHWLKGVDIVHYFNNKRVIPNWVFVTAQNSEF